VKTIKEVNSLQGENALDSYDKFLFWDISPVRVRFLPPEFVIPRIVRYGTLNDVMRLFVIYSHEVIRGVVEKDKELDPTEQAFLMMVNDLKLTSLR
jgi:hypothetical protein